MSESPLLLFPFSPLLTREFLDFDSWLEHVEERRDVQRVDQVNQEAAHHRHQQERARRRTITLDERFHIGDGIGRRTEAETDLAEQQQTEDVSSGPPQE